MLSYQNQQISKAFQKSVYFKKLNQNQPILKALPKSAYSKSFSKISTFKSFTKISIFTRWEHCAVPWCEDASNLKVTTPAITYNPGDSKQICHIQIQIQIQMQ